MPPTLEQFRKTAVASGWIGESELSAVLAEAFPNAPPTSQVLGNELIFRRQLTRLQVEAIQSDRVQSLEFGHYRLVDKLGEGGMGEVYLAWHQHMKREVALKRLSGAALKSPASVARFQREAQAAARLTHRNVVAAYDAGCHEGQHYLVMEYVPGSNLLELIRQRGPLPWTKAVDFTRQAAQGLEYAHAQGVVHRDIKPGNLLVTADGQVKVADLGLARIVDGTVSDSSLTAASGTLMGTADFMAPEQALNTRDADARSDMYSLGCTLYFMLHARPMYSGPTAVERMTAHREQPIPPLRGTAAEDGRKPVSVPQSLEGVFRSMVAKKPADRYASMTELLRALRDVEDDEPTLSHVHDRIPGKGSTTDTTARSVSTSDTLPQIRPVRPRPGGPPAWLLGTAAVVAFLLIAAIVLLANGFGRGARPDPAAAPKVDRRTP